MLIAPVIFAGIVIALFLAYSLNPALGGTIKKEYKQHLSHSPNYQDERFINPVPAPIARPDWKTLKKVFKKDPRRKPLFPVNTAKFNPVDFESGKPDPGIRFSWFGHSSVLVRVEGKTLLIDPVFSKRASMFSWLGPKRFDYTVQMSAKDLPEIDAVLISHDHYDHLDYCVIKALADKVTHFFVPLGVRVHLEKWGIPAGNIVDLDLWDEVQISDGLNLVLTPSRHFSGRGLTNRFSTLWGGWAILGEHHKIYFSADSGYFDGFKKIGQQLGPFDLAFIECGQYNKAWEAIHMLPEQSAQAAADVNARMVVPIHWGKFKLSIHSWTEPVESFLEASTNYAYKTITPVPNEVITVNKNAAVNDWWRK